MTIIDVTSVDLYPDLVVLRDGLKRIPPLPKSKIREYKAHLNIAESVGADAEIISEIRLYLNTILSSRGGSSKFHSERKFEPIQNSYGNCRNMENIRRYSKIFM